MKQVIAFTATNRPHYMRQVLESWEKVRGVEDCVLEFHVEPGCPEMAEVCVAADFAETYVSVNPTRLGVQRNPYETLSAVFDYHKDADFVILAEDDLVVSDDVLEYFWWCRERYADDKQVMGVSAFQHHELPGGLGAVGLKQWFSVWVWGIWRDRWEDYIKPDWTFLYEHKGWDWRISEYWCRDNGYVFAEPALSRSQHIGQYGGAHMPPDQFPSLQSDCFQPRVEPVTYRDVVWADRPSWTAHTKLGSPPVPA